jgi:DNA-binding LacI/PurR family transcriptional regulator
MPPTSHRPPGRQPLTTAEIAEMAGVSVATVSKVLNGRADVAAPTRRLVENVINKHGHRRRRRPSPAAPLVEVVLTSLGGSYAMEIIKGVDRAARQRGLGVVASGLQGAREPGADWLAGMLVRRPTGVITAFCTPSAEQREQLRTRGIPLVVVDPPVEPGDVPSVAVTNWDGGLDAARHLVALGHRRIGVVAGPPRVLAGRARLDGYRAGLDEAGIAVDPELIRTGEFQVEDGAACARELLSRRDRPTALFACSDSQAAGVYHAAHELGLRIPDQLSVVGFDDTPPASWMVPPLTAIRQPIAAMGEAAAAMVVRLAAGETSGPTRLVLPTELVVRGSTGPPSR